MEVSSETSRMAADAASREVAAESFMNQLGSGAPAAAAAQLDPALGEVALEVLDHLEELGAEELDLPGEQALDARQGGRVARAILGQAQQHAPVEHQRRVEALLLGAHLAPLLEALV